MKKEYVQSLSNPNVYCLLNRYSNGTYDVDILTEWNEPIDGKVVGTFMVYESGYNVDTGEIYDEVSVFWKD